MAPKKSWVQLRLEYATALALMGTLRVLPAAAAQIVARGAARLLDLSLPKLRRVGRKNLSFAFPALSTAERERILEGVFRSIARLLFALARFPSIHAGNVREWISYEGLENYVRAKKRGNGILVATAHLGNWELSAFAHGLMTEPMHVMVRALDNPLIDELVESRRAQSGNDLIYKTDAARSVVKALRNNETVGVLIDQNTTAAEGVFIDFFGKKACAGSAFAKLAYRTKAAVIPGFALWNEAARKYTLHFYPEIQMTGDVEADTQRIHSFIESVVRLYPDQWMWIHRRWKTRPPGEEFLY